jgi:hypothetical protein
MHAFHQDRTAIAPGNWRPAQRSHIGAHGGMGLAAITTGRAAESRRRAFDPAPQSA